MGIYINTGNVGFQDYTNGEYVDKTGMIAYVNSTISYNVKTKKHRCRIE